MREEREKRNKERETKREIGTGEGGSVGEVLALHLHREDPGSDPCVNS